MTTAMALELKSQSMVVEGPIIPSLGFGSCAELDRTRGREAKIVTRESYTRRTGSCINPQCPGGSIDGLSLFPHSTGLGQLDVRVT